MIGRGVKLRVFGASLTAASWNIISKSLSYPTSTCTCIRTGFLKSPFTSFNPVLRVYMSGAKSVGSDEYWQERWVDNAIRFHKIEVNPTLVKFIDRMTAGQDKCRVFVPLSGKSMDMKWLADRGHTVVGVELSQVAIEDFFEESKIDYTSSRVDDVNDAELYKSKDSSILLYKASLFELNSNILGTFDCVWDCASLVALLSGDRQRYADLCGTLVKQTSRYLLSTTEYDQSRMNGPPFSTPQTVIQQLYGKSWDIKLLEETDGLSDKWKSRGLDAMLDRAQLLTRKDI